MKQQEFDSLKRWLSEWEPLFEAVKAAIIEKHGKGPDVMAELDDLEHHFDILHSVADKQTATRH